MHDQQTNELRRIAESMRTDENVIWMPGQDDCPDNEGGFPATALDAIQNGGYVGCSDLAELLQYIADMLEN